MKLSHVNWSAMRSAVYVTVAGVAGITTAAGFATPDQVEPIVQAVGGIVSALALVMAAANTNKGGSAPVTVPTVPVELPTVPDPTDSVDDLRDVAEYMGSIPTGSLG